MEGCHSTDHSFLAFPHFTAPDLWLLVSPFSQSVLWFYTALWLNSNNWRLTVRCLRTQANKNQSVATISPGTAEWKGKKQHMGKGWAPVRLSWFSGKVLCCDCIRLLPQTGGTALPAAMSQGLKDFWLHPIWLFISLRITLLKAFLLLQHKSKINYLD